MHEATRSSSVADPIGSEGIPGVLVALTPQRPSPVACAPKLKTRNLPPLRLNPVGPLVVHADTHLYDGDINLWYSHSHGICELNPRILASSP